MEMIRRIELKRIKAFGSMHNCVHRAWDLPNGTVLKSSSFGEKVWVIGHILRNQSVHLP